MLRYLLLSCALLVILVGCPKSEEEEVLVQKETVVVADMYEYDSFTVNKEDILSIEFEVTSGGNVDLFLMNEADFELYELVVAGTDTTFGYYTRYLNTSSICAGITIHDSGTYYIVIDNLTNGLEGEAVPTGDVEFSLTVTRR